MLGAGGISAVTLSAYFGRLPVLFWFSVMSFITAAWSAQPGSFESFEAARILHGFFSTVTQAVSEVLEILGITTHNVPGRLDVDQRHVLLP